MGPRTFATITCLLIAVYSVTSSAEPKPQVAQAALKMKCSLALTESRSATTDTDVAPEYLCFRNEVSTESPKKPVCVLRQINSSNNSNIVLYGLPGATVNSPPLTADRPCESNGINQILGLPISDTETTLNLVSRSPLVAPTLVVLNGASAFAKEIAKVQSQVNLNKIKGAERDIPQPGNAAQDTTKVQHYNVVVYYGTDRKYVQGAAAAQTFTGDRSDGGALSLGKVTVSIPFSHKPGELEAPSIFRLELTPNADKDVVLESVQKISYGDFYNGIQKQVANSPRHDAFVFVHGYNTTFEDAARRTAQMAYDMKFKGAPIFYSWPAGDQVWQYTTAEANVEWSYNHLASFLNDVVQKSGAQNIYLIAHSMGNRALTNALNTLSITSQLKPAKAFRSIILAAPDVDADLFTEIEKNISATTTEDITLYASDSDKAILASQKFHTYRRLGQAGAGIVVMSGMDSIDATAVDTSFLGHTYLADSPPVLNDISDIVDLDWPVFKRPDLTQSSGSSGRYWKFHL